MKRDIPKYDNTGLFPPGAKETWDNFLATFETDYGSTAESPVWLLDTFQPVNERCPPISTPSLDPKILSKNNAEKETRKVGIYI